MDIIVNQKSFSVSHDCSIQKLLETVFSQLPNGIALAVNQQIISKNSWQQTQLKTGDNVTIIKATQGG